MSSRDIDESSENVLSEWTDRRDSELADPEVEEDAPLAIGEDAGRSARKR